MYKAIAANLSFWLLPFVPLLVVSYYYATTRRVAVVELQLMDTHRMALYYLLAQMGGPVLLLILLGLYFHPLYRKWYGLPEE